jgi:hypothetical protein
MRRRTPLAADERFRSDAADRQTVQDGYALVIETDRS